MAAKARFLPMPQATDTRIIMSLREQQKQGRRTRILDTAEGLIRHSADIEFTMRQLAAAAEVSLATPFNLFGSKEGLLYSLLARSLDHITVAGLNFRSSDAMVHVVEAGENVVQTFLADPDFLRPLYQVLLSVSHPGHRPEFMRRAFEYWRRATLTNPHIRSMQQASLTDAVAGALMAHFIGLLELWVHRDIDDRQFSQRTKSGIILIVMSVVPEGVRRPLEIAWDEVRARE